MQYSACVASIRLLSQGYALHRIAVAVRCEVCLQSCILCPVCSSESTSSCSEGRVGDRTAQREERQAGRKGGRGSEGAELTAQHTRERYRESPVVTSAVATAATSARRRLDRHQNRTDQE